MSTETSIEQGDRVEGDSHVGQDKIHGDKYITTTQFNGILGEILGRVMDLQETSTGLEHKTRNIERKVTEHCVEVDKLEHRVNRHDGLFLAVILLIGLQTSAIVWIAVTVINHIGG